jgi:hypothetical protein
MLFKKFTINSTYDFMTTTIRQGRYTSAIYTINSSKTIGTILLWSEYHHISITIGENRTDKRSTLICETNLFGLQQLWSYTHILTVQAYLFEIHSVRIGSQSLVVVQRLVPWIPVVSSESIAFGRVVEQHVAGTVDVILANRPTLPIDGGG